MKTRRARVAQARWDTRVHLHAIARPHFGYPPLEESWWPVPLVKRWEEWRPSTPPESSRRLYHLIGEPIVPSLVYFMVDPELFFNAERRHRFHMHLRQQTRSDWIVREDLLSVRWLVIERIVSTTVIQLSDHETYRMRDTATPTLPRPRTRLFRDIIGGLFRDEWTDTGSDDPASSTGQINRR